MRIFVFYPDTYVRVAGGRSVVLCTGRGGGAIFPLALSGEEYPALIEETEENTQAIDRMELARAGYRLTCQVPPFVPKRQIHIGSSVTGTDGLTPYAEGFHTKSLLRRLNLHLHNAEPMDPAVCRQIDYPLTNTTGQLPKEFLDFIIAEYEGDLVLSGDVDDYMIHEILEPIGEWFNKRGRDRGRRLGIRIRTLSRPVNVDRILDRAPSVAKEVIFGRNNIPSWEQIKEHEDFTAQIDLAEEIDLTLMLEVTSDVEVLTKSMTEGGVYWEGRPGIRKVPILLGEEAKSDEEANHFAEMSAALRMSRRDIFASNKSMRRIMERRLANMDMIGSLSVDPYGIIWCGAQKVGNVAEGDFYGQVNRWVHTPGCAWWLTRARWKRCRGCLLRDLCPSVSIYEQMGILECACAAGCEVK